MSLKFLKNAKGQVAIFVVLIFQVLFILFAMTINIAMVTYDKINLQNSLDLAAYYGAKKQSEVLNAMAHINYQMRQNWKLLAWRYRILGTLIQYEGGDGNLPYWCPQNFDSQYTSTTNNNCKVISCQPPGVDGCPPLEAMTQCQSAQSILNDSYGLNYCDAYYFVCISHDLWKRGVSSNSFMNLCNKLGVNIPPVTELNVSAGFMAEAWLAAGGVRELQREVSASCPAEGALNWLMTQFFMTHFRLDQKDRKVMIEEIYNKTLKEGKDLDGESIFEGSAKVFCKNLSQANKTNLTAFCSNYPTDGELKAHNSFEGKDFKDIFEKLNVWPVLQFLYDPSENSDCNVEVGLHHQEEGLTSQQELIFGNVRRLLGNTKPGPHLLYNHLTNEVRNLFKLNGKAYFHQAHVAQDPLRELTLSLFKKKDQILYYGLTVDFEYQSDHQVFSLNLSEPIKFKASAFAKPFGASFGPQPEQSDPLIPVHHSSAPSSIPNSNQLNSVLLQPNHSRFPGDKWGLIDKRLHDNSLPINFLNKHKAYEDRQRVYTMEDYFHLILYQGEADDPLARNPSYDPYSFTRMMELMAVYPDLYDISYYSIFGNYHQTYFKKICKLLRGSDCDPNERNQFPSSVSSGRPVYIRGDFGWPDTKKYLDRNYSERNIELSIAPYFLNQDNEKVRTNLINRPQNTSIPGTPLKPAATLWGPNSPPRLYPNYPLSQGNLFYPWLANPLPDRLLSSWTNPDPLNYQKYEFPDNRFMECSGPAREDMPVPSACASGGRSGYSVKLISCETVKDFADQPSNIDEYCPN